MKYCYALLFLLIICPFLSSAQNNYKPGYVVTLKGDTVHGFVEYKNWGNNPEKINFKKEFQTIKAESYSKQDIMSFAAKGYPTYRLFAVAVSLAPVANNSLLKGIDTLYKTETVFLKEISVGINVTLYKYTDDIKERFYVAEHNEEPIELIYRVYLTNRDDESVSVTQRRYKQQLLNLATTYQPQDVRLKRDIEIADYSSDLERIVTELNDSKASGVFARHDHENRIRFFAGTGVNSSMVKIDGNVSYSQGVEVSQGIVDLNGASGFSSTSTSLFPMLTGGADIPIDRNSNTLLRLHLNLTGNNIRFTSINPEVTNKPGQNTSYTSVFSLDQYIISFKPHIIYNLYNQKNFKFYLGAGFSLNNSIYGQKKSYRTYHPTQVTESEVFLPIQSFYFSVVTKIGFVINNKLDFYVSYEPQSSFGYSTMHITTEQLGITYFF